MTGTNNPTADASNKLSETHEILAQISASMMSSEDILGQFTRSSIRDSNINDKTNNNNEVVNHDAKSPGKIYPTDVDVGSQSEKSIRFEASHHQSVDSKTKMIRMTTLTSDNLLDGKLHRSDCHFLADSDDHTSTYRMNPATADDLLSMASIVPYSRKVRQ